MKQSTHSVLVLPVLMGGWALQRNSVVRKAQWVLHGFDWPHTKIPGGDVKFCSSKNLKAKLVLIKLTYFRCLCKITWNRGFQKKACTSLLTANLIWMIFLAPWELKLLIGKVVFWEIACKRIIIWHLTQYDPEIQEPWISLTLPCSAFF